MKDFFISLSFLFSFLLVNIFPDFYIFLSVIVFYIFLFSLFIFKFKFKRDQIIINFLTLLAFLLMFLLVESQFLRIIFSFLVASCFLFINFWFKTSLKRSIYLSEKPLRRILMFILVFDVFAFLSGIFAINNYFTSIPFFFPALFAGIFVGFVSFLLWSLYFKTEQKILFLWSFLLALVVNEFCLVFYFLPFGFFVNSLLITWLWYIMQLYVRFHISQKGIIWEKQKKFLFINFLLYILTLYIIRWI
ncbi:MAG: hypothetical protein WC414_01710 [Patescibacteria group bacterium]